MTKLVFSQPLDFLEIDISSAFSGSVDSFSSTLIQLSETHYSGDVFGQGFAYNPITDTYSGTVTGTDVFLDGSQLFSASKINVSLATLIAHKNDANALINDLLGGKDSIMGSRGGDALYGFGGNDTIKGGKGGDLIVGGAGKDTLTGGDGIDAFVYLSLSDSTKKAPDLITDLDNSDIINLSALHQSTMITVASSYDAVSGLTTFAVDVTGDGRGDLFITATGDHTDFNDFFI